MAVNINIDLDIGQAQTKIAALKTELENLDDEGIDLGDLGLDELVENLENVGDVMDDLSRKVNNLDSDLADTLADLDDIEIGFADGPDGETGATGGEADPPDKATDGGMSFSEFRHKLQNLYGRDQSFAASLAQFSQREGSLRDPESGQFMSYPQVIQRLQDNGYNLEGISVGTSSSEVFDGGSSMPSANNLGNIDTVEKFNKKFKQLNPRLMRANRAAGKFGSVLKRMRPTMQKWWALLAAIIPLAITFAVQALGVAAALGAVATAGAAVIGLGLLGHADDMGDAWASAKDRLSDLKRELFETFQPTMRQFAPISDRFLDFAPGQLGQVAEAMEGLTAYEGTIFDGFEGAVDWIDEAVTGIAETEDVASQLAMRFGEILGNNLIDFFGFLVEEASNNQEMLVQLGGVIVDVAVTIYELSKAFTRLVIIVAPLFDILRGFAEFLNNPFVAAILGVLVPLTLLAYTILKIQMVVMKLKLALMILSTVGNSALASLALKGGAYLKGLMAQVWAATASIKGLRTALLTTGIGALLVGGGMLAATAYNSATPSNPSNKPGGGGGMPGSSVNYDQRSYTFNVNGDMDRAQENRLKDIGKTRTPSSGNSGSGALNSQGNSK